MGLFDEVSKRVANASTARLAKAVVARYAPPYARNTARAVIDGYVSGGISEALRGGIQAAEASAIAMARTRVATFLNRFGAGALLGVLSSFESGPSRVIGGVTLSRAREIFEQSANTNFARKNLFLLSITEISPKEGVGAVNINLFATEVSYTPITIQGDPIAIGSAVFDAQKGTERVEIRVTTLDDEAGNIKAWFKAKADAMTHGDGTFGLPVEYLMRLRVTHSIIDEDFIGKDGASVGEYLVRPGGMELGLSRREDALEEIQMTFVQHDTFSTVR